VNLIGLSAVPSAIRVPYTFKPALTPYLACSKLTVVPGLTLRVTPRATDTPGRFASMLSNQVVSSEMKPETRETSGSWVGTGAGIGAGAGGGGGGAAAGGRGGATQLTMRAIATNNRTK